MMPIPKHLDIATPPRKYALGNYIQASANTSGNTPPDDVCHTHQPRTALGVKLLALRRSYIESGGTLLDENALEAELRARRGGRANA
jgi:hypothetical protein